LTGYCELDEEFICVCSGPEPFFEHEIVSSLPTVPEEIRSRPSILKRIERGETVPLSKTLSKELKLHIDFAHIAVSSVIHGLATSTSLGSSFLTGSDIEIRFLNSLQPSMELADRNQIAFDHLSSMVPFIEDVELPDVIKVRKREEDAFIAFRGALNSAIDEFTAASSNFSEKQAEQLYADVIMPSVASLNQRVKLAKKDLISKPVKSLLGISGVISFGLLSGLIPQDVAAVAEAIGLVKFGSDLVQDLLSMGDKERSVKTEKCYFLWKVHSKSTD
jgi:hypothetical protein